LASCGGKTLAATMAMIAAIIITKQLLPTGSSRIDDAWKIGCQIIIGGIAFYAVALTLRSSALLALAPWSRRQVSSLAP
jgi:hypothetical protein